MGIILLPMTRTVTTVLAIACSNFQLCITVYTANISKAIIEDIY